MTLSDEEFLDAIHNAATGSDDKMRYFGTPTATRPQSLKLQRQLIRFLDDMDRDLNVGELLDRLNLLEEQ
jgi:hypothetical protein